MFLTIGANEIDHSRGIGYGLLAAFHFAVQDPERIGLKSPLTIFAELKRFFLKKLFEFFPVSRPTLSATERIDLELKRLKSYLPQEMHEHDNDFGIDHGVIHPEDLCVDLIKLTVATFLRSLISEHRSHKVDFCHGIKRVHLMFQIGPSHGGSGFGSKGQGITALIRECVHLLFNDVCGLANASSKEFSPFNDRDSKFRESETLEDLSRSIFNKVPLPDLLGKDVVKSSNRLDFHG
jgi:hypothetical protein